MIFSNSKCAQLPIHPATVGPQESEVFEKESEVVNQCSPVIIVTSSNRAEPVQDVPLAIQVVTGEGIRSQGIDDLRELTKLTPSGTFARSIFPNDFRVAIR